MNTILISDHSGKVLYTDSIPPPLLNHILKDFIPTVASGPFGNFLFQVTRTPEANVWYNNYLMTIYDGITCKGKLPRLELQFSLSNSFCFHSATLGDREMHDGSFNFSYTPHVHNHIKMEPGRIYTTVDIELDPVLVSRIAVFYPILLPFLEKVAAKKASLLCEINQVTNDNMSIIIEQMLRNSFSGGLREMYVANKVVELLIVTLDKITTQPTVDQISFRKEEIEKIYMAKDELHLNLDMPMTLLILSRKVGLNMHKLKTGFSQFYGVTIAFYRLQARMKEAKILLNTTDDSVESIGYSTGYSNARHFSKAFKKQHGSTPKQYREGIQG